MKISLIVPVLNEMGKIDDFLKQLSELPGEWEVVFGDGGSTDGTLEKLEGKYQVVVSSRGRANQMNAAAKQSTGEVLVFLHCDSVLPHDLCHQVQEVLKQGYEFGCFRIRFDSKHLLMKCCGFFSNLRVKYRKIAFGDQGIFLTRRLFEEVGGFLELPIMEDYSLSLSLKGRYPLGQTKGWIVTSARRFERGGMLRTMWKMQKLQYQFRKGYSVEEIAKQYSNVR